MKRHWKPNSVVGVDVSKTELECFVLPTEDRIRASQDFHDVERLAEKIAALRPDLVVIEATGGYERPLLRALLARKVPVNRVNPRRVRRFAQGLGVAAKNDPNDAEMNAHLGATGKLWPMSFPSGAVEQLEEWVQRRQQLLELITMERNRLCSFEDPEIKAMLRRHIAALVREQKRIELRIEEMIEDTPELAAKYARLLTVAAVGPATAAVLVAKVPELGKLTRRKVAAIVGLAPYDDDSGNHQGKRFIWGGRVEVRCALYMAALVGTRYNPVLRETYKRLLAEGKPKKLALVACMRKLLVILNAMLRDETDWRQIRPTAA
jgi:transposase